MKKLLIAFCVALALTLPAHAEVGGGAINLDDATATTTFKLQGLLEQVMGEVSEEVADTAELEIVDLSETETVVDLTEEMSLEDIAAEINLDTTFAEKVQAKREALSMEDMKNKILAKRAAKAENQVEKTEGKTLAKAGPASNLIVITMLAMLGVVASAARRRA